ncbi:hypothetical protein N7462_001463 [Penicillium macrosclerotiorum]|uniref:uncharacterized protein n=1 Tax=Penicillium macrosclerotiorum TaxID=303699 RepID=UPI00254912E6|nr:uncharacterized protein N7462_001463 [Penicillium macrosclerotiorum]KAJ5692040.1 hypothetical protein N7462_001463 [Penicillium macrosclerotiorum]
MSFSKHKKPMIDLMRAIPALPASAQPRKWLRGTVGVEVPDSISSTVRHARDRIQSLAITDNSIDTANPS